MLLIGIFLIIIRQAEEMHREDTDMGPASDNVITFDDELSPNGKLLQQSDANLCNSSMDNISVCSCTCYPRHVVILLYFGFISLEKFFLNQTFLHIYRRTFKVFINGRVVQEEFTEVMRVEQKKNFTVWKQFQQF